MKASMKKKWQAKNEIKQNVTAQERAKLFAIHACSVRIYMDATGSMYRLAVGGMQQVDTLI